MYTLFSLIIFLHGSPLGQLLNEFDDLDDMSHKGAYTVFASADRRRKSIAQHVFKSLAIRYALRGYDVTMKSASGNPCFHIFALKCANNSEYAEQSRFGRTSRSAERRPHEAPGL